VHKPWLMVLLVFVVLAAACGGGEGLSSTSIPTPSALRTQTLTPTAVTSPTLTPQATDGTEPLPLSLGETAGLPPNVALIVEIGCAHCDGPTAGLVRVYRDSSGQIRVDSLFNAHENTEADPGSFITSFALDSDASEIVVALCSTPEKCAWLGYAAPDAKTTLFRSLDGGVTWSEYALLQGDHRVVAVTNSGVLLLGPLNTEGEKVWLFPSGDAVEAPPGGRWPLSLAGGELFWLTEEGRLLRSDGSLFLDLGPTSPLLTQAKYHRNPSEQSLLVFFWRETLEPQTGRYYLGLVGRDGGLGQVFSLPPPGWVVPGPWLDSTRMVASVEVASYLSPEVATRYPEGYMGNVLAIIDLEERTINPIVDPFLDPPFAWGRNYVQAVLRGPFARVVGTGSCLNVRAEPGAAGQVLGCAADGVLLRDTGETQEVDGVTWLRVITPAGLEGWASTVYLER